MLSTVSTLQSFRGSLHAVDERAHKLCIQESRPAGHLYNNMRLRRTIFKIVHSASQTANCFGACSLTFNSMSGLTVKVKETRKLLTPLLISTTPTATKRRIKYSSVNLHLLCRSFLKNDTANPKNVLLNWDLSCSFSDIPGSNREHEVSRQCGGNRKCNTYHDHDKKHFSAGMSNSKQLIASADGGGCCSSSSNRQNIVSKVRSKSNTTWNTNSVPSSSSFVSRLQRLSVQAGALFGDEVIMRGCAMMRGQICDCGPTCACVGCPIHGTDPSISSTVCYPNI